MIGQWEVKTDLGLGVAGVARREITGLDQGLHTQDLAQNRTPVPDLDPEAIVTLVMIVISSHGRDPSLVRDQQVTKKIHQDDTKALAVARMTRSQNEANFTWSFRNENATKRNIDRANVAKLKRTTRRL